MSLNPEEVCQKIYFEAQDFFGEARRPFNYGFKILYGPPIIRAPVLFIGYQPGGADDDHERKVNRGSDKGWPAICEYATESWILAKTMRKMFGRAFLEQCTGLNAIFLRAPSVDFYNRQLDQSSRTAIKEFCLPRVGRMVEAINPQKIVAIGFSTLELFGGGNPDLLHEKTGFALTKVGKICERRAVATQHLSGARISNHNLSRIAKRVVEFE